jgi:Karyopherin (importin) alpha
LIAAGNIVGESPTIRDQFIESSLTQNLIDYIDQYHSHQGIWALCNLVRGIPPPKPEFCKIIFPALVQKASNFQTPDEKSMAEDCMWTLVDVTGESVILFVKI